MPECDAGKLLDAAVQLSSCCIGTRDLPCWLKYTLNDRAGRGQWAPKDRVPIIFSSWAAWLCLRCLALRDIGKAKAWIKVLRVNSTEQLEASPDDSPAVPKS